METHHVYLSVFCVYFVTVNVAGLDPQLIPFASVTTQRNCHPFKPASTVTSNVAVFAPGCPEFDHAEEAFFRDCH